MLATPSFVTRCAMAIFPRSCFADRVTGKPGLIRILLNRLGPSVLSSPLRRMVQTLSLFLFIVLFFYVCWPYSARPAAVGQQSDNWRLVEVEQHTGSFRFEADLRPDWIGDEATVLYVTNGNDGSSYVGAFKVANIAGNMLSLRPVGELSPAALDSLLLAQGTWSFGETEPDRWPSHYADDLAQKEFIPAELFLVIDPLVSMSTAIASRSWVWSLTCAAIILVACFFIPRGFCGYLCPLGTLIDLFDWSFSRRVVRFRVASDGWWVHIKYYLLAGTLVAAMCGVLVSGYVAAIPVVTRGLLFLGEPLQSGMARGWHLVPPMHVGHTFSLALFAIVLGLGFLQPRFWCKYVCPSGAIFSLGNLLRVTERKVESTCINCNKCVEICPFDAIKPDFTTRTTDCTLCQTCGGVCPTQAIKFVERWNLVELKVENDPPTGETPLGRRGFLALATGSAAAIVGGTSVAVATRTFGARLDDPTSFRPVRPPGSVPEQEFLEMCIRCGECFKACPNNVLQAEGFQQGLEGLWTPMVNADWAGCESSCNACGQVCPTGAIRALPLEEKKVARMGLAVVNNSTCLPYENREACQLCVDECNMAGYEAIEFINVHTQLDSQGKPIEGTGFVAPVVLRDKCVGCGLCQTRCYAINVKEKQLLTASAIVIEAGAGNEDRLMTGSYIELRENERSQRRPDSPKFENEFFVPSGDTPSVDPLVPDPTPDAASDDPFGLNS
ncbi:MAG: 4Fe-4S binding protein [Planctomycetales bacterium]|nr:4Fe-4S binding protein [Planctomycetales bacterium]